jgi:hypothetical protein
VWLFILFAVNLSAAALFVIPNHTWFPFEIGEGNITVLFPVLLFTCLGFYCLHRRIEGGREWLLPGLVMIITSMLQMYNFMRLVNSALQEDYELLRFPPESWLVTLVPWLIIVWFTCKRSPVSWRTISGHLVVLLTVLVFLVPGAENPILSECYYFLLSSCIGYSCFCFLLVEYRHNHGLSLPADP